jgi:hypothetical protein
VVAIAAPVALYDMDETTEKRHWFSHKLDQAETFFDQ